MLLQVTMQNAHKKNAAISRVEKTTNKQTKIPPLGLNYIHSVTCPRLYSVWKCKRAQTYIYIMCFLLAVPADSLAGFWRGLWEILFDIKQTGQIPPFFLTPTSLRVGTANIPFRNCARNLGFMISDSMVFDKHISTVCRCVCVEIRRISPIHQYLIVE